MLNPIDAYPALSVQSNEYLSHSTDCTLKKQTTGRSTNQVIVSASTPPI